MAFVLVMPPTPLGHSLDLLSLGGVSWVYGHCSIPPMPRHDGSPLAPVPGKPGAICCLPRCLANRKSIGCHPICAEARCPCGSPLEIGSCGWQLAIPSSYPPLGIAIQRSAGPASRQPSTLRRRPNHHSTVSRQLVLHTVPLGWRPASTGHGPLGILPPFRHLAVFLTGTAAASGSDWTLSSGDTKAWAMGAARAPP